MKKLLSIILTCVLTLSTMVIPATADEIYYPCYVGTWTNTDSGNPIQLKINSVNGNNMNFYFQYGQFAVTIKDAVIDGTTVNGNYYEVWDGGDFIVNGSIFLDLGDSSIWLDWHPYENGVAGDVKGFMMYNRNFKYQTIKSETPQTNVSDEINVVVNGNKLTFEQAPIMYNDRVMVPIRAISESLGAEVSWNDVRKVGRVVGIKKGNKEISFYADETEYANPSQMSIYTEGDYQSSQITLDAPIMIYNDYTLVPVRAVSEAFDADVSWDGNTKTVNISAN